MAKKIVILEDQRDVGELMRVKLEKAGYAVVWRQNGRDAWDAILAHKADLAILDVMVPGMSGWDVLSTIKSDQRTKHIPVLMATAKGQQRDVVAAIRSGAVDYLVKPFKPNVLLEHVQRLLGDAAATAPHPSPGKPAGEDSNKPGGSDA